MTAEIVDFQKYRERKERAEKQSRTVKPKAKRKNETAVPAPEPSGGHLDNDGGNHGGESA